MIRKIHCQKIVIDFFDPIFSVGGAQWIPSDPDAWKPVATNSPTHKGKSIQTKFGEHVGEESNDSRNKVPRSNYVGTLLPYCPSVRLREPDRPHALRKNASSFVSKRKNSSGFCQNDHVVVFLHSCSR